jgi:hypothetical protein
MTIHPTRFNTPLNASKIDDTKAPTADSSSLKPLAAADFRQQLKSAIDASDSEQPQRRPDLRPLTQLEMIPGVRGPLKPLARPTLDDRPGIPPVGPLLPMNQRTDLVPHNTKGPRTEEDKVTATARKWISQTFYGTLLKQMRSSPFKSELFEGGRGGQAFAPLLDQHLADHMARGADNKLVKAIARKLLKTSTARKPATNDNPYQDVKIHVAPSLRA